MSPPSGALMHCEFFLAASAKSSLPLMISCRRASSFWRAGLHVGLGGVRAKPEHDVAGPDDDAVEEVAVLLVVALEVVLR